MLFDKDPSVTKINFLETFEYSGLAFFDLLTILSILIKTYPLLQSRDSIQL